MSLNVYSQTDGAGNTSYNVDGGSGANRYLVIGIIGGTTDDVTSVTWNSESLTQIAKDNVAHIFGRYIYFYGGYITGTGTQTLAITGTSADSYTWVFSGAHPTNNPKSSYHTQNNGSIMDLPTSAAPGDWLVGCMSSVLGNQQAGSNTTMRSAGNNLADSNGYSNPSSINFTYTSSDGAGISVAITPAPDLTGRVIIF